MTVAFDELILRIINQRVWRIRNAPTTASYPTPRYLPTQAEHKETARELVENKVTPMPINTQYRGKLFGHETQAVNSRSSAT